MPRRSHVSRHRHEGPPLAVHSLMEARAFAEFAALPLTLPLLREAPQGDGHPVLLVPGFMASERLAFGLVALLVDALLPHVEEKRFHACPAQMGRLREVAQTLPLIEGLQGRAAQLQALLSARHMMDAAHD